MRIWNLNPKMRIFATLVCSASAICTTSAQTDKATPVAPPSGEIVQKVDSAVHFRFEYLAGYEVKEHYAIYRNGETSSAAEMTVQTVYKQGSGKEYKPISQSGSELLRKMIIEKILTHEHEMASASNSGSYWITSANYEMRPEPNKVLLNGRECYIVDLKSKRKSPYLFDGKAWVDAADGLLVHLEGSPTQSVSFFAGDTVIARDYVRLEGISMATHAEAHSHSILLGDTVLKIDYIDYHVEVAGQDQKSPSASTKQPFLLAPMQSATVSQP